MDPFLYNIYYCWTGFSSPLLNHVFVPGSGNQISIVLWGERALAFEGEWVLETSKESPIIAIFVGTLVKNYEGKYSYAYSVIVVQYLPLFIQT